MGLCPPRRPGGGMGAGTLRMGTLGSVSAAGYRGSALFKPETLNWTLWQKPDFTGLPWAGSASGGASGSRSLITNGGLDPSTGATLNGYTSAGFSRTAPDRAQASVTMANIIDTNRFTFSALVRVTAIANNVFNSTASWTSNPAIWASTYWGLMIRMSAPGPQTAPYYVQLCSYDDTIGAYGGIETTFTMNSWALIQGYHDGVSYYVRVNSGAYASGARTNTRTGPATLYFGVNAAFSQYLSMDLMEFMITNQNYSSYLNILKNNYFNPKFGQSF